VTELFNCRNRKYCRPCICK